MKIKTLMSTTAALAFGLLCPPLFAHGTGASAGSSAPASAAPGAADAPSASPGATGSADGGPVWVPSAPAGVDPVNRPGDRFDAPATVYVEPARIEVAAPRFADGSPLHGGWVTPSDAALLSTAGHALDNARDMEGATVTMVANNGHLAINGSAASLEQAYRIENIARDAAGGNSVAFIDSMGG